MNVWSTDQQNNGNVVGKLRERGSKLIKTATAISGIGTTSPQNKLNVVGDANVTGAMIISSMNITVEGNGDVNVW